MKHYKHSDWQYWAEKFIIGVQSFAELLIVLACVMSGIAGPAKLIWIAITSVGWAVGVLLTFMLFHLEL